MTLPYRDSSFDRPNAAQAAAAYAAGVRVWGGYIATVPPNSVNLATSWTQANFDLVRATGMECLAYASGWDDPVALKDLAAAWRVRLMLDCEDGIRGDGAWVNPWLEASGAGLYGLCSVHYHAAPAHIVARYPGVPVDAANWDPNCPRPAGLLGWQAEGTHTDPATGLQVDGGWVDDGFAAGGTMLTPDDLAAIEAIVSAQNQPVRADIVQINDQIIAAVNAARDEILAALKTQPAPGLNHTHAVTTSGTSGQGQGVGA